jgi:hypothetical protein
MGPSLQDALHFWQRNKDEEGGGGYLAWNWDSSIWGADVLLAQQTNDPNFGGQVSRPSLWDLVEKRPLACRWAQLHCMGSSGCQQENI